MKLNRNEILLFYLPLACLFLLTPGAFNTLWKTYLSGPLILVMAISIITGIVLNLRRNRIHQDVIEQQSLRKMRETIRLTIHKDLQIGQTDDDTQIIIKGSGGSYKITVYELPGEGIALLECVLNNQIKPVTNKIPSEILVDSGQIWIRDSDIATQPYELAVWQTEDSSMSLIVDTDQQLRGVVINPPYGDGGYSLWKDATGFVLELIPGIHSTEKTKS